MTDKEAPPITEPEGKEGEGQDTPTTPDPAGDPPSPPEEVKEAPSPEAGVKGKSPDVVLKDQATRELLNLAESRLLAIKSVCEDPAYYGVSLSVIQVKQVLDRIKGLATP